MSGIGVVYQSRNRASASQSHLEGGAAKLRTHVILHRPTDDLTRGHVLHASQIKRMRWFQPIDLMYS